MWFAFGLVTLLGTFLFALVARRRSGWRGERSRDGGIEHELQRVHGGKRRGERDAPLMLVRLGVADVPPRFDFALRRQGPLDRLGMRLGVAAERDFRDPVFDDAVYVESDDALLGHLLASDPGLRRRIADAFATAPARHCALIALRARGGRLWAELHVARDPGDPVPTAVRTLLPLLDALAQALRTPGARALEGRDRFVLRAVSVLALNTAILVAGVVLSLRAVAGRDDLLQPGALFGLSVAPALLAWLAYVLFAWRLLGRSARAHLVLAELLLLGGVGFALAGFGAAREANLAFDAAPARLVDSDGITTEQKVVHSRRGRQVRFYLVPGSWPADLPPVARLRIDESTYVRLGTARRARLHVKPGALGFAWVERVEASTP